MVLLIVHDIYQIEVTAFAISRTNINMEGQMSNTGDEGETNESFGVPDSTILGGCPFHGRVERDEIPTHESPPKQSGTLPCPALHSTPVPSTPSPLPACCCASQCTPCVRLSS